MLYSFGFYFTVALNLLRLYFCGNLFLSNFAGYYFVRTWLPACYDFMVTLLQFLFNGDSFAVVNISRVFLCGLSIAITYLLLLFQG